MEVITSVERQRRWSQEDKERLVAACLEPGAVFSEIARSAGIHVSQLFRWRRSFAKSRSRGRKQRARWCRWSCPRPRFQPRLFPRGHPPHRRPEAQRCDD
ncbi:transposase [Rhizobium leguminosarum]|nr:transposase [Rhizobium leguminosarum]MBY5564924.1 transposase [Rhizobium leguminosarum]MBY5625579.1 transposase [Rhizobium leguminosarum]MBY5693607.1 transposase [Rhizobium leguminosarum]MBY5728290.1 transposase [Rhizobium leguminosarum]